MQNKTKKIWITSLTIVLFMSISCQRLSFRNEEAIRGEESYYLIDPNTILADIEQGKAGVFSSQTVTPQAPLSQSLSVVRWTQEDYLNIVQALYKSIWNESTDNWKLRYAWFSMKCDNVDDGPQFAHFIFYKVVQAQQETRVERQIYIDPSNNAVGWVEVKYFPNLLQLLPIEFPEYQVTVSDALRIAEDNGGREIRIRADNECKVSGELINTSDNWRVSYVKTLDLFSIDIDALTGNYKIVDVQAK
jgi:hypothetical protein